MPAKRRSTARWSDFGGFDHNEQTFRILTLLERRYAAFDGLNLTWECLEGVVKHNGPLIGAAASEKAPQPPCSRHNRRLLRDPAGSGARYLAGPEAQVAAIGRRHRLQQPRHRRRPARRPVLGSPISASCRWSGRSIAEFRPAIPGLESGRLIHESIRRLIDLMVTDLIEETRRRLEKAQPQAAAEVRGVGPALVAFSPAMVEHEQVKRRFLFERMYRHHKVNQMTSRARDRGRICSNST